MLQHKNSPKIMNQLLGLVAAVLTVLPCTLALPTSPDAKLPIVELPYELHQALSYNATGDYYMFSNIRYAAPPLGDLRWRAPATPTVDKTTIQNGSETRVCVQGIPTWQANILDVVGDYISGVKPYTLAGFEADVANASFPIPDLNKVASEDCLFLDVYAPKTAFNKANNQNTTNGSPVLVWVHGGGYVLGSKRDNNDGYNPATLIADSLIANPDEGLIFVAINYRLGALGFMGGQTTQANGAANAAFLDQRMALDWVQDNIHLFGGDRNRVTFMGESGGGGSVIAQLTAYGGVKPPFSQAVAQSAAALPQIGNIQLEQILQTFLQLLNVTTLDEARLLPSESLMAANQQHIGSSPPGTYIYGPTMDGDFMRETTFGAMLQLGMYDPSVKVMVGHNINEGGFFADPTIKNESAFAQYISNSFQGIAPQSLDYLVNTLYPPVFDGSHGYVDYFTRTSAFTADAVFNCNAWFLNQAYQNTSYSYEFSITPGFHIQDLFYTFSPYESSIPNVEIADNLQQYLTSFAMTGVPTSNVKNAPVFPVYGLQENQLNFTDTGVVTSRSNVNVTRCQWWQKALFN